MEESISGFKQRGTWGDVVEHGERVTQALREAGAAERSEAAEGGAGSEATRDRADERRESAEEEAGSVRPTDGRPQNDERRPQEAASEATRDGAEVDYIDAFDAWDEWRPKSHERIEDEVNEKTADQASVDEGAGEKAGRSADDDLQTASERLAESYEKLENGEDSTAVEKWQDSLGHVKRAADTAGRKALRKVENVVYQNVMTQVAPYYFDNELVSANIQRIRSQDEFVFEVNVNDDDLKEAVRDHLQSFEDIERWHVDTERDTETAEAAEGVEPPEQNSDAKFTRN